MTLRVGFNATPLLSSLTGVANYVIELGNALAETGAVDVHSYYGGRWRHEVPMPPARGDRQSRMWRARGLIRPFVPFKRSLWQATQRTLFARGLRERAISLYHEPNYVPLSYEVPVVTTVHDLSWLRYPGTHPPDRVRWLEKWLPRSLSDSAAVLVDSEFVRREVVATFGVAPARVHAVHLGVAERFHPRDAEQTRVTLRAYDLEHGGYVLSMGTIEPRKNVLHAVNAYARLPRAMRDRYPLVVGGAPGWRASQLMRDLDASAAKGDIRFVGHIPYDHLPDLYAGAAAFVFSSLYEGFGLPPLEAMASGVPVLVSDRASLPEVVGDAALLIDPDVPESTTAKLYALLEDVEKRAELIRRGLARARDLSWAACARATLDVYRSVSDVATG